jgi:tRNA threonylcarbamoyladenosine biosynthesis protein TsaB
MLLLGIDTCGPSGSVALGRLARADIVLLGETTLEGRTYSATLVAAIGDLLKAHHLVLQQIGCIVVVNGPGSFTGVRVGLSAAKGLAEGAGLRIVAVSRLEVLAQKSGLPNAALDAHRHELFLRVDGRELLAGSAEMAAILPAPAPIAAGDDAAVHLLSQAWPAAQILRVPAPTAADALRVALPRIRAREFADTALLDGHYLRRSDAEIFGEKQPSPARE